MVIGSGIWGIFCSVINSYRICQTYRAHLSLAIKKHVYSVISMPHFIISNQLYITAFHRCVLNIVVLYWTILYNRLISLPWCLLNKIQTMAISLTISWFGTTTIWSVLLYNYVRIVHSSSIWQCRMCWNILSHNVIIPFWYDSRKTTPTTTNH